MKIDKVTDINALIPYMMKDITLVYEQIGYEDDYEKLASIMPSTLEEQTLEGFVLKDKNMFGFILFLYRENEVYVPSYGLYAEGEDTDKVLYELYKYASNKWVEDGFKKHWIDCLNLDKYKNSLLQVGFGYEQVYGILDLDLFNVEDNPISVRSIQANDKNLLRKMADVIYSYQNQAPVFAVATDERVNQIRDGYMNLINDKEVKFYIAEEGNPVAFAGLWENEYGYLLPEKSIELTIVGTFIEMASKGVGTRLINYVMDNLIKHGYRWVTSDWRIANITSRRFWRDKTGFKEVKFRMIRYLDPTYEKYLF